MGLFSQTVALAVALSGCSAQPHRAPAGTGVHANVQPVEQCSFFAAMACSAVTFLSGEGIAASTCSVHRVSGETRIETCGSEAKAPTTAAGVARANTHPVRLSWVDNSNDENEFVIERCDRIILAGEGQSKTAACAGEWRRIGSVAANATSYVDHTALSNQTYIYRVKASNNAGDSNYTSEIPVTTPSP
jgi:hypothetical protein